MSRYKENYTLFKRGKYWYYRTYDERGVRTTAHTTGKTNKTQAKEYCENLYLSGGLNVSCESFGQFAAHFYDDGSVYLKDRTKPLSQNTLLAYRKNMTSYILPVFKDAKIADINYLKLKQFRSKLLESLSVATTRNILATMENIIKSAYRNGMISKNPFEMLETLSNNTKSRGCFTLDEIKQIYQMMPEQYQRGLIVLALTGMRVNEGLFVTSDDIVDDHIHLTRQKQRGQWCEPKTNKSRDIPIINELKQYFYEETIPNTFRVNLSNCIKVIDPDNKRNLAVHSLRHFFITDAKSFGINPLKVETIAGHSLQGIEKTYTNFSVDDLKEILQWQKKTYDFIVK